MIETSQAWKDAQKEPFTPEAFIEITCGVTDVGALDGAYSTAPEENVTRFSPSSIIKNDFEGRNYASLELNLWILDGSCEVLENKQYDDLGYVANIITNDATAHVGTFIIEFPAVRTTPIPGMTITWSSYLGEYPRSFTIDVYNGSTLVRTMTVSDNDSAESVVDFEIVDYDRIDVTMYDWSMPCHCARVERVYLGHVLVFDKRDLFSFSHEQVGALNSEKLPKNAITFSVNNIDGRWNPNNPSGIAGYLSEQQQINVRYGYLIGDSVEWIQGGRFYLSEWSATSNGLDASFVARDAFEFMMNQKYTGITSGTLRQICNAAVSQADIDGLSVSFDDVLSDHSANFTNDDYTVAEIIQLCANAAGCVVWQDRYGVLQIHPLATDKSGYAITSDVSYAQPEITLSKPLGAVSVKYSGGASYTLSVGGSGETQTVENKLISTSAQAGIVAAAVKETLESRKTVSGEYRANPSADVFDIVYVDTKYGYVHIALTDVTYTFTGAFHGTFSGRVLNVPEYSSKLGEFVIGASKIV